MRDIIYDVAVSIDGFIAAFDKQGNADASAFPTTGSHVEDYSERLQSYDTVIMGRKTYEFGYQFGLPPGARAYPHMEHFIFSRSLDLPDNSDVNLVKDDWLARIDGLKGKSGQPIYLCGGGEFAGFLLENSRIDILRLKIAPVILGNGIRMFGATGAPTLVKSSAFKRHKNGVHYVEYRLI